MRVSPRGGVFDDWRDLSNRSLWYVWRRRRTFLSVNEIKGRKYQGVRKQSMKGVYRLFRHCMGLMFERELKGKSGKLTSAWLQRFDHRVYNTEDISRSHFQTTCAVDTSLQFAASAEQPEAVSHGGLGARMEIGAIRMRLLTQDRSLQFMRDFLCDSDSL